MKQYEYAVVVGRFQPFHNHHKALVDRAIALANRVIIVIGSSSSKRTQKNPFLPTERTRMIRDCYPGEHLFIIHALDYPNNDNEWAEQIYSRVEALTNDSRSVVLVANCKEGEDYIPRILSDFEQDVTYHNYSGNGTDVRRIFFQDGAYVVDHMVPEAVMYYLRNFENSRYYDAALDAYVGSDDDAA